LISVYDGLLCVVHEFTHRFDRAILRVLLTFLGKLPDL